MVHHCEVGDADPHLVHETTRVIEERVCIKLRHLIAVDESPCPVAFRLKRGYATELANAQAAGTTIRAGMDWYAFTLAFKGVFLEGLEVAFIVLAFGTSQGSIPLAALGAGRETAPVAGREYHCRRKSVYPLLHPQLKFSVY